MVIRAVIISEAIVLVTIKCVTRGGFHFGFNDLI